MQRQQRLEQAAQHNVPSMPETVAEARAEARARAMAPARGTAPVS